MNDDLELGVKLTWGGVGIHRGLYH